MLPDLTTNSTSSTHTVSWLGTGEECAVCVCVCVTEA